MSLANLLAVEAACANTDLRPVTGKSVIFLFLHGGPSQIETFDPKLDAPAEIRSVTGEVETRLPGITFGSEGLSRLTSAGGDQSGWRYLPSMRAVPVRPWDDQFVLRVLAFFAQDPSGKTLLHSIDLTGYNERVMKTPMDGSDPAWSPLLENQ